MTDEDEANIKLGKPVLQGIDPTTPDLLLISVPLAPKPSARWLAILKAGPPGVSDSPGMVPPQVTGSGHLLLRAPDDEIEKYIEQARRLVEGTNAYWNRDVGPQMKRERERAQAMLSDEQRRLEEAQKRLDNL